MESRQVLQQHKTGEVAVPNRRLKQKNGAAGRQNNRRALGDIGNMVTIGGVDVKPIPNVSRPITRSFCAQLLAKEKAAAAVNNKNPLGENGNVPHGARQGNKAAARNLSETKAASKSKPGEIIEISPDSNEIAEKETMPLEKAKAGKNSSKEKALTLTSTLTARSKAACGLAHNKLKDRIADIDAADTDNHLAVVEYVEEMYTFYKSAENEGRAYDYMDSQPEINTKMRAILIDWLIQVHYKFDLSSETLYLTINIIDRYLASKATARRELQLVGMGALLIASKYEEIWAPEVNELVNISDRSYTNAQVLGMEKRILGALEWNLTVPTPYVFLVRFIKASMTDSVVENMVYFLAELGMMNYATLVYSPSMIAASAVYVARCTLNKAPHWNETLKLHTCFSEPQLMDCAKLLVSFHMLAPDERLKGVYRKYCSSNRGAVALLPPAKKLLAANPIA